MQTESQWQEVWIERASKSPFFPQARQCFSFHVAVPENGLCPGISWGAPPHGPQTQVGQDYPPFLPPGADPPLTKLPVHPPSPPPGQDAGTWPMSLTPCPCGPERSLAQSRHSKSDDGMKEHASAGVRGPRSRRACVQIQLRLRNGRILLCKRVDLHTYVMAAAGFNA